MPQASNHDVLLPDVPALGAVETWDGVFRGEARAALEAALPRFMMPRRWFASKARTVRQTEILETVPILPRAQLVLVRVSYTDGHAETYVLPVEWAAGEAAVALAAERPASVIASLQTGGEHGILYDAVWDPAFCQALLDAIIEHREYAGTSGDVVASTAAVLQRLVGDAPQQLPPVLLGVEQSNTSVRFGDRLIMKLYRRLETGINPDQEIGQFLTDRCSFANTPPVAGVLEFRSHGADAARAEPITMALLQGFVPNRGDAWAYTLDALRDYFRAHAGSSLAAEDLALPKTPLLDLARHGVPAQAEQLIGPYLASARLLGRRTAELHLALCSDPADPAFAPEPFTPEFQAYLHRSMRSLTDRMMQLLRDRFDALPAAGQADAVRVLALEGEIAARFDTLLARPISALRARIHGDYHLGQVLYTGDDFMIIDFEGEPARPLRERQMKRSPLQDVAGMLRSFHYAAYAAYFAEAGAGASTSALEPLARYWHRWVSVAFLRTYLDVAEGAAFLPPSPDNLRLLLDAYLLEKAVYELGYELNNRPAWVRIPLQGILQTI